MVCKEKEKVDAKFNDIVEIDAGKKVLRIKARVIRLWKVPQFSNPSEFSSLEMVLLDEKLKTKVRPSESSAIPELGLNKTSIQNVINTTRILINPDIPDVESFKNSIAVHGIDSDNSVPLIGDRGKPYVEEEFLHCNRCATSAIGIMEYSLSLSFYALFLVHMYWYFFLGFIVLYANHSSRGAYGNGISLSGEGNVDIEFDHVADILPGKENVPIKVRVIHLWKVPAFLNPSESSSLEMVLIDEKCWLIGWC
ncbi:hypothetical protein TSUD_55840 [Trifolium subterraneum]|uniref:DUF223 domain-containing protein n=1 Tax=Trifolium subterraneum TaxID=3900 RepID=A0A2Z6N204_TRISU|nr:hypothetical protein TSUD_55840 [Trifolium subterraneum]